MRVAGQIFVFINGEQKAARGQFNISPFSTMKEGVVGLDGVHGHAEVPKIPFIEGTFTRQDATDLRARDLQGLTGATITVEAATGTFVLKDAYVAGEPTFNPETGEMSVRFEGREITE